MKKIKDILIAVTFFAVIFGFAIGHLVLADKEVSKSERRTLAIFPEFSTEAILSEDFSGELESYLLDQFPKRESFRSIKANFVLNVLRQKDNNNIYRVGDSVYKWENQLDKDQIQYFADKVNSISKKYFKNSKVFYSVIPDKNYFVAEKNGYPSLDYGCLMSMVKSGITEAKYVDIFNDLTIEDYYRTDAHWNQAHLEKVVNTLGNAMGITNRLSPWSSYKEKNLYPFYGVYGGQSALSVKPDTITYLENEVTKKATVTGVEFQGEVPVYTTDLFSDMDSYDVFLNGPKALLYIDNPKATTDKELIIFRDSFGSSLSPLLISAYSKITVIDLRYMAADFLKEFISTKSNPDVLFIYSTSLINSGRLLK